ncbi:MAG: site-specific integrase, partial [Desulfobacterales bacterium]|nr:site-specific integrase [Desulfobacterales bacterium]
MPVQKRFETKYAGVYYIKSKAIGSNKSEKIYYIRYRKKGSMIDEKAGRQYQDDMTPAKASGMRARRIEGKEPTNKEKRAFEGAEKEAESNRWTINKLWAAYKENRPDLKGIVTDENRFNNYIEPNFGKKEPRELIQLEIDRLRINLLKKKAPQTVKHVLELLRRVTNFGFRKGLSKRLNFSIEMPKVSNLKTEDLDPDQLTELLKVIEKDDHPDAGPMMKMALFTGMRRGEMFKLKWSDVDFDRGFINLTDPKGGPDQKIPLNDAVRELLKSHPRTKSQFVFPGRGGRKRTDIKHQVNKIKKEAGLPKDFRPLHGLRHVYASMLASSGEVDMYVLQRLLTHKSPLMTQ